MIKQFFSLIVSAMVILFSGMTVTYAKENNTEKIVVNEYAGILKMQQLSNNKLRSLGYDNEKINTIKNFKEDYINYMKKISKFDDKVLGNMGYNDDEITMLRNYKGTDAENYALSANCNVYINQNSHFSYSSKNQLNSAAIDISFAWDKAPNYTLTDILAVT